LAFLLACTPARNSDLFLHMASGRLLSQGRPPWGIDPFSSTTTGAHWVNPTWLSDVALYQLYEFGGSQALVFARGALVVFLTALLFCFRRPNASLGLLCLTTTATVLALGPWLVLQPILLSVVGVALTLYLLERPGLVKESHLSRARAQCWLLVPLFALWANLDAWFVLGPVLVGLYAAGEMLRTPRTGEMRSLVLLALAGLGACLLTPYHYHTFSWPVPLGLTHAEQALMGDPLGRGLVVSPFSTSFMGSATFASPGAWAYYLLLVPGLASFFLPGQAGAPGRLLGFLALAALSIYQARTIPFFAVVAGPAIALNLQEWARQVTVTPRRKQMLVGAQGLGVLVGIVLLVLAWPGFLQPAPYQPRGWAVEPDRSLVRLAQRLNVWRVQGKLPSDHHAFTFSPEVGNYLAWFCPAEKGFLDSRLPLFDGVAADFVLVRRALLDSGGPKVDLGPLLDAHHIDRIILHDPDWGRTTQTFRALLLDRGHWDLLAIEGSTAVFGRRSGLEGPSLWKGMNPLRGAYHPEPEDRAPLTAPRPPEPPDPFDAFYRRRDDSPADRAEAALYLAYFDLMAQRVSADLAMQWQLAQTVSILGAGAGQGSVPVSTALSLRFSFLFTPAGLSPLAQRVFTGFAALRDRGPPWALLLAIRAARRALAVNPDDGGAYLFLGEAYLRLARQTREQAWSILLPRLAGIRRAQAVTALHQAARLRPDLEQAHALLAQLHGQAGQLDAALDHLQARLRIARQEADKPGPQAEAAAERRDALLREVDAVEGEVRRAQNIYNTNAASKADPSMVYERAQLAYRHGLTRKALELLMESSPAIFGQRGILMQLELMLQLGRAFEVRDVLESSGLYWLRAQAAAACGDYAAVDEELDQMSEGLRQLAVTQKQLLPVRSVVALRVGEAVLVRPVAGAGPVGLAGGLYLQERALRPLPIPADLLRQEADLRVLRGMLALEAGAVESARQHFQAALAVWGSPQRARDGAGLDFASRPIAAEMMRLLEG
jgi:tetratricopeptide (TPR) repeat protein